MVTVAAYSAIYGGYDTFGPQAMPVRLFTEATDPLPETDPRKAAKWWKLRPDLACPDADVTIWLDGRMEVLMPDLAERCLDALGDADALFVRHPFWDDLEREAVESRHWTKYDNQPLEAQVAAYKAAGHPAHGGLAHGGFLVRRNNPRVLAFDLCWWHEIETWGIQDQLSLPEVLRLDPALRYRWWSPSPLDCEPDGVGWVRWRHRVDAWRSF